MKNYYNKYKAWKLMIIHKWAQYYADLIVVRLSESKTEFEFDFWLMKGYSLNEKMISQYNIYLE